MDLFHQWAGPQCKWSISSFCSATRDAHYSVTSKKTIEERKTKALTHTHSRLNPTKKNLSGISLSPPRNNQIMSGTPDFFYREAQRLGYVARSAFKLLQMQKQYKLIKPGSSVLDLGCAPGAWLQVACQNLGPLETGGVVVGIDTKKVKVPSTHCDARVKTVSADVLNFQRHQVRALSPKQKGFSVILSDMCPLVSGISSKDAALSAELGMRAIDLAVGSSAINREETIANEKAPCHSSASDAEEGLLQRGGHLVIKLLESEDIKEFNQICKPLFRKASWLRPKATRSCSREIYLICQGLL